MTPLTNPYFPLQAFLQYQLHISLSLSPRTVSEPSFEAVHNMPHHVRLNEARCICCQHCIVTGERVAAGMPYRQTPSIVNFSSQTIVLAHSANISMPFAFPPHGPRFKYIAVEGEEPWRLCRYPPCLNCQKSPKTFAFHVDCFKLASSKLPTLPFKKLVKLAVLRTSWSFPHLVKHSGMGVVEVGILDILKRIGRLPLELSLAIIGYCNDSPLWRYCEVTAWYSPELYDQQGTLIQE